MNIVPAPGDCLYHIKHDPHPNVVAGYLREDEGERLAFLARSVPRSHTILEIGCMRGRSTCYMGLASLAGKEARIVALDTWRTHRAAEWRQRGTEDRRRFLLNLQRFGLESLVTPVEAYSREIAKVWTRRIGCLFLDGDHSYQGVAGDYDEFAHHIAPGGWLAIHDYSEGWDGIKRFVDQVLARIDTWEDAMLTGSLLTLRKARA